MFGAVIFSVKVPVLPINSSAFKYCSTFEAELKSEAPLIAPQSIIGSVKGVNKTFPFISLLEPNFEEPIFSMLYH